MSCAREEWQNSIKRQLRKTIATTWIQSWAGVNFQSCIVCGIPESVDTKQLSSLRVNCGVQFAVVKSLNIGSLTNYLLPDLHWSREAVELGTERKVKRILDYYTRECIIWQNISSTPNAARTYNLLEFYGFMESYSYNVVPALVCKYYEMGDLYSHIYRKSQPFLSDRDKIFIIADIVKAIDFLHYHGITHRDIRAKNILLELRDNHIAGVLGDFGSAKEFLMQSTSFVRSSTTQTWDRWSPPEYEVSGEYRSGTGGGDIWQLGCTLLEALQEADPWVPLSKEEYRPLLRAHKYPVRAAEYDGGRYRKVRDTHYDFMKMCWRTKQERPSARDLYTRLVELANR
ncbi:kinase-like domain-containing protein [Phellopilus nigrolimitatus]|nr:kinase-like domain-containing protein [Phellopilus nigrolimitatus]